MYSHAQILAFLYAGALTPDQETEQFEEHQGHRPFVAKCEPLAKLIATFLNRRVHERHDGVVEYEVIEPLGKWVLHNLTEFDLTRGWDRFATTYHAWLLKGDQGLSPKQLDDKYNHDGDGQHPTHFRSAWRDAVSNQKTLFGYWEWVHHKLTA